MIWQNRIIYVGLFGIVFILVTALRFLFTIQNILSLSRFTSLIILLDQIY